MLVYYFPVSTLSNVRSRSIPFFVVGGGVIHTTCRLGLTRQVNAMPALIVTYDHGEAVHDLPEGKPVFVGRAPECDIILPSHLVSRKHAVFIAKNGLVGVKDLNSFNGTLLNGQRIAVPQPLGDGDVISIADFTIRYAAAPARAGVVTAKIESPAGADETQVLSTPVPTPDPPVLRPSRAMLAAAEMLGHVSNRLPRHASRDTMAMPAAPRGPAPEPPPEKADTPSESTAPPDPPAIPNHPATREKPAESTTPERANGLDMTSENGQRPGTPEAAEPPSTSGTGAPRAAAPAPDAEVRIENNDFSIGSKLRAAVENRFLLYDQLADWSDERRLFRMQQDELHPDVVAEINRQEIELENIPFLEDLENRIDASRRNREEETKVRGYATRHDDETAAPEMQRLEDMAIAQWRLCRDSHRFDLPAVFKEAYPIVADEPLAGELLAAGINPLDLLGGAAYLLVLEKMFASAKSQGDAIEAKIEGRRREMEEEQGTGVLGRVSNLFQNPEERLEELAGLEEEARPFRRLTAAIGREMAFLERFLIREFWDVYDKAAVTFAGAETGGMPTSVRAFLRCGAIGLSPWWLPEAARVGLLVELTEDVVVHPETGTRTTTILYADEYLEAVASHDLPPSPATDAEDAETKKALRQQALVIETRSYLRMMREMLSDLYDRMDELDERLLELDKRISNYGSFSQATKQQQYALFKEQQGAVTRRENWSKYAERLEQELAGSYAASLREAEEPFRTGALAYPAPDRLLRRECARLRDHVRLLNGGRERFQPLALREMFTSSPDLLNDRNAAGRDFFRLERLDPAIFMKTLIYAKKRANRVDLRLAPVVLIAPTAGGRGVCARPRRVLSGGCVVVPFIHADAESAKRLIPDLAADYRWETSAFQAGREVNAQNTLVGAFAQVRWEWRNFPKEKRERGYIHSEQSEAANWRRVYAVYFDTAEDGCDRLMSRNPDLYEALIGKHIDLPDGVAMLRRRKT